MGNKIELTVTVKSPSRESHLRKGEGFSLREIKEAERNVNQLKELNINIDYFRKSSHPENIEKLKTLKIPESTGKKRNPFVKKEKKRAIFKLKEEEKPKVKPKEIPIETPIETQKKPTVKKKVKTVKKEKAKPGKKEKVKIEEIGTPLTELSGLGTATAKKFAELGVGSVEELSKENPEELASLLKGVSLERLVKWIEEGKELIKK